MKQIKMKTEADLQRWLKSLPEDERGLVQRVLTWKCLRYAEHKHPELTKTSIRKNKTALTVLLNDMKDDNELLIGLYSIRDFGNLDMLRFARLNP